MMGLSIQEVGRKIKYMVLVCIHGMTEGVMMAHGLKIIWMVMEFILGKTVENLKDNTRRIKNMEKEYILGQTEENMMGNGIMVDNMVKENTSQRLVNLEKAYGNKEKELNGLMRFNKTEYVYIHTKIIQNTN